MSSEAITKNDLKEILEGAISQKVPVCWGSLLLPTASGTALTLTQSSQKIPLSVFDGVDCALSANGIKVNKAGVYLVSGSGYFSTGFTVNDLIHLRIYKNSTYVAEMVKRVYGADPYEVIHSGPVILNLAAGDTVYLYAYNQTGARGLVGNNVGMGITLNRIA